MSSSPSLLLVGGNSSLASSIIREAEFNGFKCTVTSRRPGDESMGPSRLFLDIQSIESILDFMSRVRDLELSGVIIAIGQPSKNAPSTSAYLQTHFINMFILLQLLFEDLSSRATGFLVYISSRSALYPSRDPAYAAVKSGLTQAVRSLSMGLKEGQKAFSLAPGLISGTSMYDDMPSWIRQDHELRAGGKLLSPETFATELFRVVNDRHNRESGAVIELGPRY